MIRATSLSGAVALVLLTASGSAQNLVGFGVNSDVGAASRVGLAPQEYMLRIESTEYVGYCIDATNPAMHSFTGVSVTLEDGDAVSTPETVNCRIYPDDPANPGYPDLANGVVAAMNIPGPTTGNPRGAVLSVTTFATPVSLPTGQDIFVSWELGAAGISGTGIDGIFLHTVYGSSTGPRFDLAGAGLPSSPQGSPANSYTLTLDPTTGAFGYARTRQILTDLMGTNSGGVVAAITNQTSFPASNTAPGTGDFMSGLHPDAANPPFNATRADDVSYIYSDAALGSNGLVVFLAAGAFGPNLLPLSGVVSGSEGALCLDPNFMQLGGAVPDATGTAALVITIPAALRLSLGGVNFVQQAIAMDPTALVLRGGPCGRQVF